MDTPQPKKPARPDAQPLPPQPTTEDVVDHGVDETFPASDPVAVGSAHHRAKKQEAEETDLQPERREPPDWLLHPPRR